MYDEATDTLNLPKMQPGYRCRFLTDETGNAYAVEHVDPCPEFSGGTITDVRTGKVLTGVVAR